MTVSHAPKSLPLHWNVLRERSARRNVSAVRSSASWVRADPGVDEAEDAGDVVVVELAEGLGVSALRKLDERADP